MINLLDFVDKRDYDFTDFVWVRSRFGLFVVIYIDWKKRENKRDGDQANLKSRLLISKQTSLSLRKKIFVIKLSKN